MARRLSDQQRRILGFCWARHADGVEHVLFSEMLSELNGRERTTEQDIANRFGQVVDVAPTFREFDVAAIGVLLRADQGSRSCRQRMRVLHTRIGQPIAR